jgi:hypothetical protein
LNYVQTRHEQNVHPTVEHDHADKRTSSAISRTLSRPSEETEVLPVLFLRHLSRDGTGDRNNEHLPRSSTTFKTFVPFRRL